MNYRYYSTHRPVAPGTFPKPHGNKVILIYNRDQKGHEDFECLDYWGYIEYEKELSPEDISSYELTPQLILDDLVDINPPATALSKSTPHISLRIERKQIMSEKIIPPSNIPDKEAFKHEHEKFLAWVRSEEGQKTLTPEQIKEVEDFEKRWH